MSSNEKISPSGTFAFDYDLLGRQTLLRYPNGVEAGYGYDAAGQSTAVYHALGSYVVAYATYVYDNAGNRLSKYDLSGAHIYVYDVLHRLTFAVNLGPDGPVGAVETFEYDKAGNRIADSSGTVFDYDYANRIRWDNFYTYGHDANGNRISATGKLTGQTTSYVYDSENRRVEAHLPDGAVWTYKYDAKGRRIEKSLSGDTSKTLRYVYDNDDVLAILDGSNNLLALFTHGPGLGSPLAMRQGTTDYYYHADALGSVVALTNASGSVVESYEYTAYGKPTVRDGSGTLLGMSGVGNSFMYGGGTEHDWETGQNHMGHREQDPDAGTFMQEDPIGFAGGDLNLFAYSANNPLKYVDPLGLDYWNFNFVRDFGIPITVGVISEKGNYYPYAGFALGTPGASITHSNQNASLGWNYSAQVAPPLLGSPITGAYARGFDFGNFQPVNEFGYATPGGAISIYKVFSLDQLFQFLMKLPSYFPQPATRQGCP